MALTHNSKLAETEPKWRNVDKTKLPRNAFADMGEADKKSSWRYPHHHIVNGKEGKEGVYESGDMYLHKSGLNAAWAAAHGARSGKKASAEVLAHLNKHRKDIGADKDQAAVKARLVNNIRILNDYQTAQTNINAIREVIKEKGITDTLKALCGDILKDTAEATEAHLKERQDKIPGMITEVLNLINVDLEELEMDVTVSLEEKGCLASILESLMP